MVIIRCRQLIQLEVESGALQLMLVCLMLGILNCVLHEFPFIFHSVHWWRSQCHSTTCHSTTRQDMLVFPLFLYTSMIIMTVLQVLSLMWGCLTAQWCGAHQQILEGRSLDMSWGSMLLVKQIVLPSLNAVRIGTVKHNFHQEGQFYSRLTVMCKVWCVCLELSQDSMTIRTSFTCRWEQ